MNFSYLYVSSKTSKTSKTYYYAECLSIESDLFAFSYY